MLWLASCSADARVAEAALASAEHLETFGRLERWAARLASSDVRLRGHAALSEATFAPFRSEPDVLWAEVQSGDERLQYANPVPADAAVLRYASIDAASLGRLWVALLDDCGRRGRVALGACVVIARPALDGRPSSLRVAFRRGVLPDAGVAPQKAPSQPQARKRSR